MTWNLILAAVPLVLAVPVFRCTGRRGWAWWAGQALVALVGVLLGRVARLNSWEPVTEPQSTAERIVLAMTWRMAPLAVAVLFLAIWAGHAVTRSLGRSAGQALGALGGRLWALEHHLGFRPL
jgi:uncharacterized membrane protein